jgi:hypothetical protein
MGDVLRQMFYPLVLPAIVAAVWLHAWGVRQESRPFPAVRHVPAATTGAEPGHAIVQVPGPGYRLSTGDESVASTDVDE